jgi:hypothetical protein
MTKIQYFSDLAVHRKGIYIPTPVARTLVLAGNTGPLSSIAVQTFYRHVSRKYEAVYTVLESEDVGHKVAPNIYTLNDKVYCMADGKFITGSPHVRGADVLVHDEPCEIADIQIHSDGVFVLSGDKTLHVANSYENRRFNPVEVLHLQ